MIMSEIEKENKYIRAKHKVAKIKKFYTSLLSYLVFISLLAALNYYTNEWSYPWFLWAAFGWGIAIVIHAFKAFEWLPFMGKNWEDRKIKEFMEKDDKPKDDRWN
jgi:hypothetical protein